MKRCVAIGVLAFSMGLSACDGPAAPQDEALTATTEKVETPEAVASAPRPYNAPVADAVPAEVIAGAPTFAALYPGAQADGAPVAASGPNGPGGLITFNTDATPDSVVAFYRQRAEQAGLASIMAMNQGEARAYGAAARDRGASLQVVAAPGEDGLTSVQLSWSAGA